MYSPSQKQYVLIDFGLTHAVEGGVYEESKLPFVGGTTSYIHKNIRDQKTCMKKFYMQYSDYYSFRQTL